MYFLRTAIIPLSLPQKSLLPSVQCSSTVKHGHAEPMPLALLYQFQLTWYEPRVIKQGVGIIKLANNRRSKLGRMEIARIFGVDRLNPWRVVQSRLRCQCPTRSSCSRDLDYENVPSCPFGWPTCKYLRENGGLISTSGFTSYINALAHDHVSYVYGNRLTSTSNL